MSPIFQHEEPFGKPDGSLDDIDQSRNQIVTFPSRFGGISRDPGDARVRVVVGQLGSGKSLQLRRMQDYIAREDGSSGQVAIAVETSSELTTQSIQKFAELLSLSGGSTEDWKLLWRRGIIRSAVSHILFSPYYQPGGAQKEREALKRSLRFLGSPETPHKVTQEVQSLIQTYHTAETMRRYLYDTRWADIDNHLAQALSESAGMYLYVDDVDKNFRWAPSLWIQCQRGLFYTVMDLLREDYLRSKLHVVMALRDVAFSSVKVSEQASRYVDMTHISVLSWNRSSMRYLLDAKLQTLPAEYFANPKIRSVESWLGADRIANRRLDARNEPMAQYLIRHTSMVPRDLIRMGNALCAEIRGLDGAKPSYSRIQEIVSASAAEAATRQAAQCANQALSDIIPADAYRKDYHHIYLNPNSYALQAARDHVFACIESVGTEAFAAQELPKIDSLAANLFNAAGTLRMCDILWQQGLLGYVDDSGDGHYYRVDNLDGSNLAAPRHAGVRNYIWNPLVFDLQINVVPTLAMPLWPA